MEICVGLLKEPLLEDAIRSGDCLAMLVEYYHGSGNMKEAFVYVREMESRNIALNPYVDAQVMTHCHNTHTLSYHNHPIIIHPLIA